MSSVLLFFQNIYTELVLSFMIQICPPISTFLSLSSLQVLQIDVLAHKTTVETVNKAGNELVESSAGEEASALQSKLENLNQRWKAIQEKTAQRKQQLESVLIQVCYVSNKVLSLSPPHSFCILWSFLFITLKGCFDVRGI